MATRSKTADAAVSPAINLRLKVMVLATGTLFLASSQGHAGAGKGSLRGTRGRASLAGTEQIGEAQIGTAPRRKASFLDFSNLRQSFGPGHVFRAVGGIKDAGR